MLTIKKFNKGERVYSVKKARTASGTFEIKEETVTCVGKKYLTTGEGYYKKRYMEWNREYLLEKVEYGENSYLFRNEKDAQDYMEKQELVLWLGCMSCATAECYSVEQLRKVKEILKGEVNKDE